MGLFDTIAGGVSDFLGGSLSGGDILGGLVGGGLSYLGARESASAARSAAQAEADALRQSAAAAQAAAQPWGVGSLGGTAGFDEDSRTALLNLSPQLADIYQGALDRSGLFGGQATAIGADPFDAANYFFEQQQQYWDPREEQLRTDAETRLMAQGRLGSTGGQRALGELEESIASSQQQRRTQSFNQAQALVDTLLGREAGDIGTATGLLNIPMQQANLGLGLGANLGGQAAAGLQARSRAANILGQSQAGSSMGSTLSGLGGLFLNNLQPQKQA